MKKVLRLKLPLTIFFLFQIFWNHFAFAGAPSVMTFQSKIVSPSGTALEAASVNFRFTILDSAGTCVLYVEDYSNINMTGTQGVVAIPLGSGTKTYPPTATSLYEVFNNSTASFNCQAGGTMSPTSTDNRQVVMQFNDGSGWQTLPQMAINAVPFANYATRAESLGAYAANAYLRPATLPTCTATQAITWDGSTFTCMTPSGGGSTYTGVTSISNASGDITLAPAAGTGAVRITSNTPSTNTTTGSVVVTGGMGVSGAINAGGNITTSGSVSSTSILSTTSVFTPQLYGTSTASGNIRIDGTSNATKGNVLLATAGGNVGIGTTSPSSLLHTNQTISTFSNETRMVYNSVNFQPAAPLAGGNGGTGIANEVTFSGTNSFGNSYNWGNRTSASSSLTAPASMGTLNALSGQAYQSGDGMAIDLTAVEGDAIKASVGDVVRLYGVRSVARNLNATGQVNNSFGVHSTVLNQAGATTLNAYGVYTGSIQGTNKWSFYASDATTPSYFGGNVGIGTTTPSERLHVAGGDIRIDSGQR